MKTFTAADRLAARQAKQARRATELVATQHHKLHWLDESWWLALAKERVIRLPPLHRPTTVAGLRKWAKTLRKTPFSEHFGCSPRKLIELNPRVPLRAFVGQMLEP
mgnify:FL=1